MEDCQRASSRKSQAIWRNRFAVLKLGTTNNCCDCEADLPGDHREGEYARDSVTGLPRVNDTPKLVDDPLDDAFEFRQELQVYPPSLSPLFMLIGTLSGDERSTTDDEGGLGAGWKGRNPFGSGGFHHECVFREV